VILELNHYVFLFLVAGILLHWRPRSFVKSITAAVPSVAGVLVQYPMYAGMVKMMTSRTGPAYGVSSWTSRRSTATRCSGIYSASWDSSFRRPAGSG
jgi:short subunit fatty acids transporter